MIKIRLNITTDYPPAEYRLKGTQTWQSSSIFTVPALTGAGAYTIEVRDAEGCLKEYTIEEPELAIILAGGTSHTGSVFAKWKTNIEAESKIYWGIDPDSLDESMEYNNQFNTEHVIEFPVGYVGSLHYFKAFSRSKLGQVVETDILGLYFVPGTFEAEAVLQAFVFDLEKPSAQSLNVDVNAIDVQGNIGPDRKPSGNYTVDSTELLKLTKNEVSSEISNGFSTNIIIV